MSDNLGGDAAKPINEPNDLSEAIKNLSVAADDSDKKSTSKNLSDMPTDVVRLIIERSDYKEQLLLRKTSKSLRSLVDQQKPACKFIHVFFQFRTDLFHEDVGANIFISYPYPNVMYTVGCGDEIDFDIKITRDDFEKIAFDDLAFTLKNPKLHLEEFKVHCNFYEDDGIRKYSKNIQNVLESLNHQFSVKACTIQLFSPPHILSILPYLKPGVLKKITLEKGGFDWSRDSEGMDQIASLEQWKQAEELKICDSFRRFPIKYATHFKRFEIWEEVVDANDLVRIRDCLSKLENFEHCELRCVVFSYPRDPFNQLGTLVSESNTEDTYHYPIPDSDCYLEFKISMEVNCIGIEKKKTSSTLPI